MAEPPRTREAPAGTPPGAVPTAGSRQVTSASEATLREIADLARKTAEFQVLQRVSAEINSTLDFAEICDVALRTMDDLFEFHHANILLLEPDGHTLKVVASRGYESQATGGRVQIGTGVIGIVAKRRKMLHVNNLGQQRAYAAAQRRETMRSDLHASLQDAVPVPGLANAESQIAIPLLMRDELIGVFSIESPVARTFGEHERDLVSIVANQIASAIHNARLYEERRHAAAALQEANASLEARVADRTEALERELRVAQALLSEARSRVEGPLVGESAAVRALRDAVARQAAAMDPLLLTGAPGSGREAVAHAVHGASGRPGAFIFVSCPELNTQHRHAAADATTPRRVDRPLLASKLELALGGTVFLDAVHELPGELQQALYDMLESHGRSRARGESPQPDVRVIASTARDPRHPATGDLPPLFRLLAGNRVSVPPLVDRREDIPALVDYFVQRHARRIGKVIDGVSPDSMRRLGAYGWPGNIRELRTVLERAVLLSRSTVLEIDEDLLDEGFSVGSYRLVSLLGSGGMGEVWLARHRLLARPAAVKLIRHDVSPGPAREQLVRRFRREAQVTAGLRSPHTVQLYDFGVSDGGVFYYVMEHLDGLDLHRVVTRFGPQPAGRVVMFLRQACRSLAEAHERGLVHRDIKPANLFVARLGTEYDHLKVLDFGIVKEQSAEDATMLSNQGIVQGTPAFMAPEIVLGEGHVDGRSDLYALACTACWVLTGQTLFDAKTPAQMLLHHAQTKPVPPSERSELPVPDELEKILMRCLEKDPARRPGSARELESERARGLCEEPWTMVEAREWWEAHAPDAAGLGPP
jgi:DNA-binding NtrC family response regulator/putative methionine-R-sulfoxide reductase with GAF domain